MVNLPRSQLSSVSSTGAGQYLCRPRSNPTSAQNGLKWSQSWPWNPIFFRENHQPIIQNWRNQEKPIIIWYPWYHFPIFPIESFIFPFIWDTESYLPIIFPLNPDVFSYDIGWFSMNFSPDTHSSILWMDKILHQVLDDLFHYLITKSCQLVHNDPSIWTCMFPKIPLECIQIIHALHVNSQFLRFS